VGGGAGSVATAGAGAVPDAGPMDCDGIEVDFLRSPLDCGTCGYDCRGGACNAGRCTPAPVTLVLSDYEPQPGTRGVAIALDELRVYFAEGDTGRIRSVGKDGSDLRALVTDLAVPCALVVGGDYLYFATCGDGQVARVPKQGGVPLIIGTEQGEVNSLAFSAGDLFWYANGAVVRAVGGTEIRTLAEVESVWAPWALTADESRVYATVRDRGPAWDGIYAIDPEGGAIDRIVEFGDLLELALDDTAIYVTAWDVTGDEGDVLEFSRAGAGTRRLVTGERRPSCIAVDETHAFYSVEDYNAVLRKVSRNGDPTPYALASGHAPGEDSWTAIFDLAVDATHVFFALGSEIKSVRK